MCPPHRQKPRPARSALARLGAVTLLGFAFTNCDRSPLSDGLPATQDCSTCHGSSNNSAPPKAVNGSTSTTTLGVGAHQKHLVSSPISAAVACDECHRVPTDLLNHPSPSGGPAAVVFGKRASADSATPVWVRSTATCANTYCHGSTLTGASDRTDPVWTRVTDTQPDCRFCHGFPPSGNHPNVSDCHLCHATVVDSNQTIVEPQLHINGTVDFFVPTVDAGDAGSASPDAGGGGP